MVIFITGCVQQTKNMKDSTYYLTLQTKEIKTEISRLEKALKSEDDSLSRPTSLYYLALLYSHFKNHEPDYKHAFKNLEEYILLDPEGAEQKSSVQYLMSLLNKLIKNENLCNELKTLITTLKQENKTLTEKYEKLVIENQNTKEIIEKLKQLDIQLEKKREKKLK
jgi:predicted Zn-dependent protease